MLFHSWKIFPLREIGVKSQLLTSTVWIWNVKTNSTEHCSRSLYLCRRYNATDVHKFKFKNLYCLLYIQCISRASMQQRRYSTNWIKLKLRLKHKHKEQINLTKNNTHLHNSIALNTLEKQNVIKHVIITSKRRFDVMITRLSCCPVHRSIPAIWLRKYKEWNNRLLAGAYATNIVLYFLHSTSVLSFNIDVVLTLSIWHK